MATADNRSDNAKGWIMICQGLQSGFDIATRSAGSDLLDPIVSATMEGYRPLALGLLPTTSKAVYIPSVFLEHEDAGIRGLSEASTQALDTWSLSNDF